MHALSAYHFTFWQLFESDVIRLYVLFVTHAPHHVGHYLPHMAKRYRAHERLLWREIRWFFNHLPAAGQYQRP